MGPGEPTTTPAWRAFTEGTDLGLSRDGLEEGRPGWDRATRGLFFRPNSASSRRGPSLHLARCPRPPRRGWAASVSRRLRVRPAGRGLQGQGGSGRDVKTVQAGGGLGGPGPADPAPRLPPCRTVTSCCRPCSPRPACAPWRCPRTCSWTAGAQRGPRPSACEPPGFRSRSAPASCSWASSPGTTGPPSPTGPPGQPEVGRARRVGAGEAQGPPRRAGVVVPGPEAWLRLAPGFSSLTH